MCDFNAQIILIYCQQAIPSHMVMKQATTMLGNRQWDLQCNCTALYALTLPVDCHSECTSKELFHATKTNSAVTWSNGPTSFSLRSTIIQLRWRQCDICLCSQEQHILVSVFAPNYTGFLLAITLIRLTATTGDMTLLVVKRAPRVLLKWHTATGHVMQSGNLYVW